MHSVPLPTKLQPPSLTLKQIYNLCEAQICALTSFKTSRVCVAFHLFRVDSQLLKPRTEPLTFKTPKNHLGKEALLVALLPCILSKSRKQSFFLSEGHFYLPLGLSWY